MAIATQAETDNIEYRYFLCDLNTNTLLTEAPFKSVSFSRSIREAGTFSGDIPITADTYNLSLYENTMPGKTALYVTRKSGNGPEVCVWGGIVWARSYNIKDRVLGVEASEFTSYLYHRVAWRTWSNEYEASISISSGTGTATLTTGSHNFSAGMPVYITFGLDSNRKYDGYYYVLASPTPTTTEFSFKQKDGVDLDISDRADEVSTITVRQDTYEYARDLLESMKVDFFDMEFPNAEIEPAAEFFQYITDVSRASNVATITLDAAHGLVVGQRVTISDLDTDQYFNGRHIVTAVTNTTFSYSNAGPDVSSTSLSPSTVTVTFAERSSGIVTLTTQSSHGFSVGDLVTVENVNGSIDGLHVITSTPTATTFRFVTIASTDIGFSPVVNVGATPQAVVSPAVKFSTYGEFSQNSGLDILYSTQALSQQDPRVNPLYRGSELRFVGEILEEYSNVVNGFEYRIDSAFDSATNSFTKTFMFLPLLPQSLQTYLTNLITDKGTVAYYVNLPLVGNTINDAYTVESNGLLYVWNGVAWVYTGGLGVIPEGTIAPISAYGADEIVFEHPGNILDADMEESAEDAATRFWVQGIDDTGIAEASLPYAAESNLTYLASGWPLLDQVEKVDTSSEEDTLYIYARQYLKEAKPPISNFSIAINGSVAPQVGTFSPGDWCSVIIDDDFVRLRLASVVEPSDLGVLVRKIEAFDVRVPDTPAVPEDVRLQLVDDGTIQNIGGLERSASGY